jgi:hypothetical protein
MATRFVWTPEGGYHYPASNFPASGQDATPRHMYWAFDAGTDETVYLPGVAPQGMTGTLTLVVFYRMASATTGSVYYRAAVEAITPADALDTDTSSSFDTINTGNGTVPGTAGYVEAISITLTNADSMAAGDMFRIEFGRDADNVSDTATGDAHVLRVELRDAA